MEWENYVLNSHSIFRIYKLVNWHSHDNMFEEKNNMQSRRIYPTLTHIDIFVYLGTHSYQLTILFFFIPEFHVIFHVTFNAFEIFCLSFLFFFFFFFLSFVTCVNEIHDFISTIFLLLLFYFDFSQFTYEIEHWNWNQTI